MQIKHYIKIIICTLVFSITVAALFSLTIAAIYAMVLGNGEIIISFNDYREGWVEVVILSITSLIVSYFIFLGIIGKNKFIKKMMDVIIYG
jgi:hypothetical protein